MTTVLLSDFAPIARGLCLEGLAVDQRRGLIRYSAVPGQPIEPTRFTLR